MSNALILIIEDEREIAEILDAYLTRDGFRTSCALDGQAAVDLYKVLKPDLIILDIGLPKQDGFSVLTELRRLGATPVIMVTARSENIDRLIALRSGADDYVVKPFNPQEVVERVKAVLRRTNGAMAQNAIVRVGSIALDRDAHEATVTTGSTPAPMSLTLSEFHLLEHLMSAPRRVFSRAELLDACLAESNALDRTVDSHISHLRKKLHDGGAKGYIQSIRGLGYRLEPYT